MTFIHYWPGHYKLASSGPDYSHDLPQGGLEIPCILTFVTKEKKDWTKTKSFIQSALEMQ